MVMAMCDEDSLPVVIDGSIESIDPCEYMYMHLLLFFELWLCICSLF